MYTHMHTPQTPPPNSNWSGSTYAKLNLICSICVCHIIRIIVPSSAVSLLFSINFHPSKPNDLFISEAHVGNFLLNLKPLFSKLASHLEHIMLMTIINPKWNINNYGPRGLLIQEKSELIFHLSA